MMTTVGEDIWSKVGAAACIVAAALLPAFVVLAIV